MIEIVSQGDFQNAIPNVLHLSIFSRLVALYVFKY
jgi:hypothetical protein